MDSTGGRRERKTKVREGALKEADALAPSWWDAEGKPGRVPSDLDERCYGSVRPLSSPPRLLDGLPGLRKPLTPSCRPQCQKLLFSATLSRDPAKIDALHLHRPVYISVEDALDPHAEDEGVDNELKFTFPAELSVRPSPSGRRVESSSTDTLSTSSAGAHDHLAVLAQAAVPLPPPPHPLDLVGLVLHQVGRGRHPPRQARRVLRGGAHRRRGRGGQARRRQGLLVRAGARRAQQGLARLQEGRRPDVRLALSLFSLSLARLPLLSER